MAIVRRRQAQETERGIAKREREWDPLDIMRGMLSWDPFREMGRMLAAPEAGFVPAFDVKETKDSYLFKADLPGVKEDDLDVSLTSNRLTVSGKREEERKEEDERYFSYERSYGSFSRSFTLPEGIDENSVSADFKNGELTIRLGKKPEVQAKKIPVLKGKEQEKAPA